MTNLVTRDLNWNSDKQQNSCPEQTFCASSNFSASNDFKTFYNYICRQHVLIVRCWSLQKCDFLLCFSNSQTGNLMRNQQNWTDKHLLTETFFFFRKPVKLYFRNLICMPAEALPHRDDGETLCYKASALRHLATEMY